MKYSSDIAYAFDAMLSIERTVIDHNMDNI